MFQTKKTKIRHYLADARNRIEAPAFCGILQDYLDGTLLAMCRIWGMQRPSIHIDWLPEYRCVSLQGAVGAVQVDVQIEERELHVAVDADEPDAFLTYPLTDKDACYRQIRDSICLH